MSQIKYLYFELNHIVGHNSTDVTIKNENVLLIKPHTNSSGVWSYSNMTEQHGFPEQTFSIVNQYWIDLDKFNEDEYTILKKYVDTVLEIVNNKINTPKESKILCSAKLEYSDYISSKKMVDDTLKLDNEDILPHINHYVKCIIGDMDTSNHMVRNKIFYILSHVSTLYMNYDINGHVYFLSEKEISNAIKGRKIIGDISKDFRENGFK